MAAEVVTPLLIARKQRGLSQDALAKASGLSESHLCRIERGHLRPSAKLTIRIWKYFDGALSRDEIMFPEFHKVERTKKPSARATAGSVAAHG